MARGLMVSEIEAFGPDHGNLEVSLTRLYSAMRYQNLIAGLNNAHAVGWGKRIPGGKMDTFAENLLLATYDVIVLCKLFLDQL